jgi:hypothetical protein
MFGMNAVISSLLNFFAKNLDTVKSAPLAFFVFLGSGFILGWLSFRSKLTNSEKRITQLEAQLGIAEPSSVYGRLTNKELRDKTITYTKKLQKFIETKQSKDGTTTYDFQPNPPGSNEQPLTKESQEYWEQKHPETVKLRSELLKRLPPECGITSCQYEKLCAEAYSNPITINCIQDIANDLKRLAHNLKT